MFITGLGISAPPRRYTQLECLQAMQDSKQFSSLQPRSHAILHKVLTGKNGIAARHLALDPISDAFELSPDILQARFALHAPALATEAAEKALLEAGRKPEDIDALIVNTCTGYLCPGLSSYAAEQLKLRPDALGLDLVGQGCGAAMPNLRTGQGLIDSGKYKNVLCVSVEVCSAALYLDDDPGVLISACLFGDGAAAAVLSGEPGSTGPRVEWKTTASLLAPEDRELLRFEHRNGMLRNILSPQVPMLAARHAKTVFENVLREAKVEASQINGWILHAGGREVLVALQKSFGLSKEDVQSSASVLQEYGNISSPFVLFALKEALSGNVPKGLWWMTSFGAGFSCHGALLEVTDGTSH